MASNNDETNKIQGWNLKELVELDDLAPAERIDLDPAKFDALVKQKGIRVKVYRSMYCPKVKSIDGAEHEIDCPLCNGSGYLDVRPICTNSFIQNQELEKIQLPEGWLDGNSVAMTFPRGIELQYFTLVELLDFTDIYFQRVVRSEGNIDRLKYNGLRVNVLVDYHGKEYFEGSDFCLTQMGDIKWSTGRGPSPETIYSVHYEAPVRFRATRAVHVNRFTQFKPKKQGGGKVQHIKMNEMWILTKEFLVLRRDNNGDERLPNPIPGYDNDSSDEGDLG
jgi:hypothetical protein